MNERIGNYLKVIELEKQTQVYSGQETYQLGIQSFRGAIFVLIK